MYYLGPPIAGYMSEGLGFPWAMRSIALLNLLFCPLCYALAPKRNNEETKVIGVSLLLKIKRDVTYLKLFLKINIHDNCWCYICELYRVTAEWKCSFYPACFSHLVCIRLFHNK